MERGKRSPGKAGWNMRLSAKVVRGERCLATERERFEEGLKKGKGRGKGRAKGPMIERVNR